MSKIALIFPGQGSQYPGMGKDVYENYKECREVFDKADEVLGIPLKGICFNGTEEELKKTQITQPAIVATSYALFKLFETLNIPYNVVAGHSVGEYTALAVSGALSFEDALRIVRKRGELMSVSTDKKSAMAAIVGLSTEQVESICRQASCLGIVVSANINSPEQIVISGEDMAVDEAVNLSLASGAKRGIKLPVSGAFHSPLMAVAGEKLAEEVDKYSFNSLNVPMVSNVNAGYVNDPETLKELVKEQITSKVLWVDIINNMVKDGVDTFIEIGPGKVLSALVKRISKEAKTFNLSDDASFLKLKEGITIGNSV
ncbi:MAG: ACP S-malonyltransferase [Armatimonadota bacterium]